MDKQELEGMNDSDLLKYIDEQKRLGRNGLTQKQIAEILDVNENTFKTRIQKLRKKGEPTSTMGEKSSTLETRGSTQKEHEEQAKQVRNKQVHMSTPTFNEREINVIKEILKERERDIQLFHEYRIYKELEKVPTDTEHVRSAFNMSTKTTERLKKFSNVRRIPLQDLVELAVINLLEQYDK